MSSPDELQYTKRHEWVRLEGGDAVIGITDFLQSLLGTIAEVELPSPGQALRHGDAAAQLRSVVSQHVLTAPLSGTVVEVNEAAAKNPRLISEDPIRAGWLFKMKVEAGEEIEHLLDAGTYHKQNADHGSSNVDSP
jgi:glycine cleavage system H protein